MGGHVAARSSFGVSNVSGDRITGWVRGEGLTARFADKSALVEDGAYEEFSKRVKVFLRERVILAMEGYVEVEITREESRVYRQVDQLLAEAVHHVIDSMEEVEEKVDGKPRETTVADVIQDETGFRVPLPTALQTSVEEAVGLHERESAPSRQGIVQVVNKAPEERVDKATSSIGNAATSRETVNVANEYPRNTQVTTPLTPATILQSKTISVRSAPILESVSQLLTRTPTSSDARPRQVRRTFILKRVGYRVIPYEDEGDEKEAFAEGEVIYVNKAHPAYRAEAQKGGELLLRHVVRLVSKVIALRHHPEGREALELQNKLIAEAIRLRQQKSISLQE